jgi:hypothetical protein
MAVAGMMPVGFVNACGLNAGGEHKLPMSVLELLLMGKDGTLDDTPKSSHSAFSTMVANDKRPRNIEPKSYSKTILVGNNDAAVLAAAEEAAKNGIQSSDFGNSC